MAGGPPPGMGQGATPGTGFPGGGRGRGIPGITPDQTQALNGMTATLAPLTAAVTAARNDLAAATFSGTKNEAAINAAIDKLKSAELALATKRSEEFSKLQAGPNKLSPDQVNALIAMGGSLPAGRGGAGGRGAAAGAPGGAGPARGMNAPPQ